MKKIVFSRPDGGVSVVTPSEGARLAFFITLPDGTRLPSGTAPFTERPVDSILRRWPVDGAVAEWAESEDAFLARIAAKDVPAGLSCWTVGESEIPTDRTFRNAWKADGSNVVHDMPKCREIHRDKMRKARAPKLAALDAAFLRALESGDVTAQARIIAAKEVLRAVTADPAIEAASTPEQLKAVWPDCLK